MSAMALYSRNYLLFFAIATIVCPLCQGKAPVKIVGGTNAFIFEWPSIVSLRLYNQHRCGGTLITKCHVVTAAHCVHNTNWKLMKVATGSADQETFRYLYDIKRVDIHSKYIGESNLHLDDIAIITLAKCIVEDATQRVAGLYKSPLGIGVRGTVVGWGQLHEEIRLSSQFLQRIDSWTMPNEECAKAYGPGVIRPTHVCTTSLPGSGFCSGDSGGPFYVNGQIAAIVSMGAKCGSGIPDIYTRVFNYLPWIQQIIQKK